MRPIAGLRVTLVSPDSHTPYSGMLPGLVAGHYRFEETHIDLERLCQWAGARFICASACGLDPVGRTLDLADRPALAWDVLSLDIGSQPELDSVPGAREHVVPVKPVALLWQRWQALHRRLAQVGSDRRVAVVGGGAGSVELVLAMARALRGERVQFSLVTAAPAVLPGYNRRARQAVDAALARYGVALHCGARVRAVSAACLHLEQGELGPYDEIFWCTAAAPAPWIAASGLETTAGGFLALRNTLQSVTEDAVFGAGDIGVQLDHPRPRAGVFAVRQGPVLAANLSRFLLGKPLREHRPQRRFLSLLSLGEQHATADRGAFSVSGHWIWHWKDRIDRGFMARFRDLPRAMPRGHFGRLPELAASAPQAPCGGCGAKVSADDLSAALDSLRQRYPRHCPPAGSADDTAALPASAGAPVLQSLDILRELVQDPFAMGRIAANHALSDLYASGARPLAALAAVTLPFAGPALQRRDLQQLLAGALETFSAVDCALLGGHTLQGSELALGFVVNGVPLAADGRLLPKRGLRPGDCLVLTKPLGTGVLFAAQMQLAADGRDVQRAVAMMTQSSYQAARLALAHGATAATDVTGFGLLCHALEMLMPEQGLRLDKADLPLLSGAGAALAAGIRSTMHEANVRSASAMAGGAVPELPVLFDPQTSGGLLIGIAPESAGPLLAALRAAGYDRAALVATVTLAGDGPRVVSA
jgi:selenide,water dikinase